ncbi:hypothetical protein Vretimale_13175 [Volvox reticuliferus]|uniref:ABC transporter domain-containing protein n=1 Tax=Volvox reticuliferus TaxID=1737510 RepID=A0A8J4GLG3_9CHLO|nr:hypothetical protein Vretifemale_14096 [Volvox reticuliferus]GIM09349.1 hypothetical protein Vretimale_13175 [Volvox reticuliferus]
MWSTARCCAVSGSGTARVSRLPPCVAAAAPSPDSPTSTSSLCLAAPGPVPSVRQLLLVSHGRRHGGAVSSGLRRRHGEGMACAAAPPTAAATMLMTHPAGAGFSSTGSYASSLDEQDEQLYDMDEELAPPPDFPVPRGETAGATLILDGVTLQAGDRDLLSDVSWRLMPGQRAGLVGANGCGKSTLLRCLAGLRHVDAGTARVSHTIQVGYLEQTAVGGSRRTVWQEARSRMTGLVAAERDIQRAERDLAAGDTAAAGRLAAAQEAWEQAGGPESDRTITHVLTGLGFRPDQFHRRCSEFSGGWQMRIALARLLLGPAGQGGSGSGALLLLDEPTNHLDSAACKWLGNFLRTGVPPTTSVVLVSHDEALLESACDRIVEVRGQQLHHYVGGFRKFLEQRAAREAQARAEAEAQQAEIDKLEEFVTRFGAKASKASQAQSKAKMLEKLKAAQTEIPAAAAATGAGDARKVALKLPRAPPCYTEAIKLTGAAVGWGPAPQQPVGEPAGQPSAASDAPKPLLSGINLIIRRGQRVLVLGPNGAGKSTLLKAIGGALPLWAGNRALGDGVRMAVFSQDLAQDLPLELSALEYVEGVARANDPGVTIEKCRQALGALGLTGNMPLQKIGVLSGGEKARVALAAFALVPANVLLLDEASNHLDAQTIEVLTGALRDFNGAIIAITHNQAFATSLNATHILRVGNGTARLTDNLGLSAKDFEHRDPPAAAAAAVGKGAAAATAAASSTNGKKGKAAVPAAATPAAAAAAPPPPPAAPAKPKTKRTTLAYKEQLEYQKLSKEMEALAKRREQIDQQLAAAAAAAGSSGYSEVERLSVELGKVSEDLEAKELRWLELAEIAGDI